MAFYLVNYDQGLAGQAPTTGGSVRPGPFSIIAAGTTVYDATHVAHGSMALRQTPVSGGYSSIGYGNSSNLNLQSQTAFATRAYFYFTVMPVGAFISVYDNTDAWVAGLAFDTGGHIRIRDAVSTALVTGTVTIPLNTWVRLELYVTAATTGALLHAAVFTNDSTTPLDTITATGVTAATISSVRFGKNNANTYATTYWLDSVAIDTAAAGFIGPYLAPAGSTPYSVWTGTQYRAVDVRVWNGSEYKTVV